MKSKSMSKILAILQNQNGETLVESVVSILVFAILMLAVSTMITFSVRMSNSYTRDGRDGQDAANLGILVTPPSPVATPKLTLKIEGDSTEIEIDLVVYNEGGFIAFAPDEGVTGP